VSKFTVNLLTYDSKALTKIRIVVARYESNESLNYLKNGKLRIRVLRGFQ